MKTLFLTLFLISTAFLALAQDYDRTKITYGLTGGSNLSWLSIKAPESVEESSNFTSPFTVGLNADIQFNDYFSIRPALMYQGKGADVEGSPDAGVITTTYNLHYLELPIDFIGHLPLGDEGANLFLGVGPFISLGLGGNSKIDGDDTSNKVSFGGNGDFKSIDFGATGVLGFQFAKGFSVSINFDIGLSNILQKNDLNIGATSAKTGTFYAGIGQSF